MPLPPKRDAQLQDLIEHVLACERLERVQDRLDHAGRSVHHCHPPAGCWRWTCGCGQGWQRELGGGWTTSP